MRGPTSRIKGRSGVLNRAQARRLPEGRWSSLDRDDIMERREERFPGCVFCSYQFGFLCFSGIWYVAMIVVSRLDGPWRSVVGAAWKLVCISKAEKFRRRTYPQCHPRGYTSQRRDRKTYHENPLAELS